MTKTIGAIDVFACANRVGRVGRECRCEPPCSRCGYGPHMAIHGPYHGQPPGSIPYGHEFQPAARAPEARPQP